MRPEQRWCKRIQCHCKVIYDLAIYNEQNLYNLAHCDGFSGTTPPSRKRQGGVNQKPQALQACILTTPGVVRGKRTYPLSALSPIAYPVTRFATTADEMTSFQHKQKQLVCNS